MSINEKQCMLYNPFNNYFDFNIQENDEKKSTTKKVLGSLSSFTNFT